MRTLCAEKLKFFIRELKQNLKLISSDRKKIVSENLSLNPVV